MKVGLDLRTNANQRFTSWKSEDGPAVGNFSMGIDPNQSTQIFVWEGTKQRWRSGRWNGQVFVGIQNMVASYIYLRLKAQQLPSRAEDVLVLQRLQQLGPLATSSQPTAFSSTSSGQTAPSRGSGPSPSPSRRASTTTPACGMYATCADQNSPICACMKGYYVPALESEWKGGNWTDGCVKQTTFLCERNTTSANAGTAVEADGFWKIYGAGEVAGLIGLVLQHRRRQRMPTYLFEQLFLQGLLCLRCRDWVFDMGR